MNMPCFQETFSHYFLLNNYNKNILLSNHFPFFRYADEIKSVGRDGYEKKFNHPFFQASVMFLGEMLCLLTFKILYKVFSLRAVSILLTLINISFIVDVTSYERLRKFNLKFDRILPCHQRTRFSSKPF